MRLALTATRRPLTALVATLAFMLGARAAGAQDSVSTPRVVPTAADSITVLTLTDGSKLQGRILDVTPTTVRFRSAIGESDIPRIAIRDIHTVAADRAHEGKVWPEDPSRTRLFFAPTGRTLRKGEKYFSDAYIFLPSFQVGLTDAFTMGAGMSIVPGIGLDRQAYYFTPKLGVLSSPNLNISVGALVAGLGGASTKGPFGIAYGVATFGGEDANLSTGAGVGYNSRTTDNSALLMLGGATRVSESLALVSENYLYTGHASSALLSGGFRFIGEKLSVDLAAFVATDAAMYPVPYLAFIYKY